MASSQRCPFVVLQAPSYVALGGAGVGFEIVHDVDERQRFFNCVPDNTTLIMPSLVASLICSTIGQSIGRCLLPPRSAKAPICFSSQPELLSVT